MNITMKLGIIAVRSFCHSNYNVYKVGISKVIQSPQNTLTPPFGNELKKKASLSYRFVINITGLRLSDVVCCLAVIDGERIRYLYLISV